MTLTRRDRWLIWERKGDKYKQVLELDILTVVMIGFILAAIVLAYNFGHFTSVYYQQQLDGLTNCINYSQKIVINNSLYIP